MVCVDDPEVACDLLVHADGRRFAVIASHADEELTVKPSLSAPSDQVPPLGLMALGDTEIVDRISLPPFGIQVFEVAES